MWILIVKDDIDFISNLIQKCLIIFKIEKYIWKIYDNIN